MKYLLPFVVFLSACSVTYSPVEKIGENEFRITTHGSAFSSIEDLNSALKQKAEKTCAGAGFEFIRNFIGDEISYKSNTAYGLGPGYSDITNTSAIAKIRCLTKDETS